MFIVPEVLWSPVSNLVYDLLQNSNNVQIFRPNFLTDSDNTNLLLYFLAFQLVGIVSSLIMALRSKLNINIWLKSLIIFILLVISIINGLVFYIAFSLRHGISY